MAVNGERLKPQFVQAREKNVRVTEIHKRSQQSTRAEAALKWEFF